MENQPKRAGLGRTSCTECRRRKVKCVYDDDQAECQQCNRHSLTCQPQNAELSLEERDEIIQGFSQFAGQVETRMIRMQTAIETLARKLDSQTSHQAHCRSDASYRGASEPFETPQSRLTASLKGLLPDKPVLSRILEHSSKFTQNWMSWPLATVSYQQQDNDFLPVKTVTLFDAGFPKDVESAFKFVDKSMSSSYQKPPNPGVVAKCIVWLCLSIKELPQRFKYSDNRAPPPFEPRFLIDNCIAKVEALYQVSSTPVCNINFVQALILQGELFLSIGRPTKAWKCIRTGIENAMLLGVHQGRSSLDRGIWEELWIRDRQLSLFLGMSHAVPVQLGPKMTEEEYPVAEKEAFRQIATVSGLLTSRNLMKEDTPSATITRTLQEMRELKAMIPEHWTKGHPRYVSYLPQAFTRAYIKILYHTFELMLNWPKCQPSNVDPQQVNDFEPSRKAILEATQEIIKAHEAMRAPEVEPNAVMRADFVDFLAFKAALVMVAVIKDKKNPMPYEESEPLWKLIDDLGDRLQKTSKAYDDAFAKQACLALKILFCASEGDYIWCGTHEVAIPYFGRLETCKVISAKDLAKRSRNGTRPSKIVVKMDSNHVVFGLPYERVPELELAADWTELGSSREYGWRTTFEFDCLTHEGF
ncbi:hypothetical protein BFJ68_g3838 [Fusarium oxysporum]|uniref:Uncharacterized protein n=1 Tax=Fusarium oxysporum TaxID=5507 RepID=A0A420R039_FUSOX|nr:hypothetical protein BFJ71_g741 [Fusarium oxysporum]RKL18817.1 hypothetical protein BFJ68_g3838 [Fusarium oxysporum]